jgi:hypothetical protein
MPELVPDSPSATVYLLLADFGRYGVSYVETDTQEADRDTIFNSIFSGEYDRPTRVVAFNTSEGLSRDVSREIAREVLNVATKADRLLGGPAKAFICITEPRSSTRG